MITYDYTLDGHTLLRMNVVRDLGVYIDSQLTFNDHLNYVVNKAARSSGLLYCSSRNFSTPESLITLYYGYMVTQSSLPT